MNKLQSNKELVAVGHQLARALSSDTPIIDITKILSHLAERLDCTTAALRATQAERDRLAAECAALKESARNAREEMESYHDDDGLFSYDADGWQMEMARRLLAADPQPVAVPDGWKLVPVYPTVAMLDEFDLIMDFGAEDSRDAWRRLISASPQKE